MKCRNYIIMLPLLSFCLMTDKNKMQNLFPGSFRKDTGNKFQIKLGPAIIKENAVLLLLYIGQLCITISSNIFL